MTSDRFMHKLALALLVLFGAFCLWQQPALVTGKLTKSEIDQYLAAADKNLPFPPDVDKQDLIQRVRAWAEADDGKPVYMLNLMRYNARIDDVPGAPKDFQGTPKEANLLYEDKAIGMLIKKGGVGASFASETQGPNVISIGKDPALDHWSRVLVIRYSSRRHFLELISDPAYAPIEPYKMMALRLLLIPTSGDLITPDYRLVLGAFFVALFLACGWWRAARRTA
ncbi:hypothetical protein RQP54_03480 [Curvibacter sp. APW13]|uniref:hypothetical protein n=1 Tax=Curvibacter sp. APW13 TaxID=3077236 RepID=UPI0028DFEAAB|nr:hypothetical protein [Curvibacter sp. APW13]MDT8989916.1 hypothetical protein [Curvibacter sp. APW13]